MQKMLKGGNKHAKEICDTCSKLSIKAQKQRHILHFEQLSTIPVVSLLLTLNKYTGQFREFFSIHHFYVSIYNQSD